MKIPDCPVTLSTCFAGGVHRGASRFPLPPRGADGALQSPETDCDIVAFIEVADVFGAVAAAYLRVVNLDALRFVEPDGLPVDLCRGVRPH